MPEPEDSSDRTPRRWATRRGHQRIVELLKRYEQTG
jgi:hypothetical protein